MKIVEVRELAPKGIKVVRFERFPDPRGYFAETYRLADFMPITGMPILQMNESTSRPGTIRGLHFQWNPHMGKLVRTQRGRMIDLFLDIRPDSPTFGELGAYDMPEAGPDAKYDEWIWIPPGFAHGNVFPEWTQITYACTGVYSRGCEATIRAASEEIDWGGVAPRLINVFEDVFHGPNLLMTDKDKNGISLVQWRAHPAIDNFRGLL